MNTDLTLIKQCAEKGAEAAAPIQKAQNSSFVTLATHFDSYADDEPARIAFAQAAIEHYLAANPMWVLASERLPEPGDEDESGCVATFSQGAGFSYFGREDLEGTRLLWTSIKHIPKLPPKYDAEFEAWYAGKSGDKDLLYSAWKAGRSKS